MKLLASLLLASLVSTSAAFAAVTPRNSAPTSEPTEILVTDNIQTQSHYYYNFGSVGLNWRESADFIVRNRSSHAIYFNNITISGSAYRAYSGCPYTLYPGQSCVTRVDFIPWYEGYHYGRLGFWLNNGNIIIDLQGYGRRW